MAPIVPGRIPVERYCITCHIPFPGTPFGTLKRLFKGTLPNNLLMKLVSPMGFEPMTY
jgi:hypothetical protein